jgi:hypothetical protein
VLEYLPDLQNRNIVVWDLLPACTVTELGEMLPDRVSNQDEDKNAYPYHFVHWPMPDPMHSWKAYVNKASGNTISRSHVAAATEANARAKMLVYLLESKLIRSLN